MAVEIFDCEQNSPEWYAARLGIPTASEFSTVMAKGEGKTRSTYMRKLAGEILTGEPAESYNNGHMERGKAMEAEALGLYSFVHDVEMTVVGFVRNGTKGCSPDRLVGATGGVEVKTRLPHLMIELLLRNEMPPEHRAQVQGGMWVAERQWWDFVCYWPKLPLFVKRIYRDEAYIANLTAEVDAFTSDLSEMVERVRNYGLASVWKES